MSHKRFKMVAAVYALVMRDDQVLLLRRYNTGNEDGNFSLPAGHLDGDEPVRAAAAREAREETGIVIQPQDLDVVHVLHRYTPAEGVTADERIEFFLRVSNWVGRPRITEPDKCDELIWASTDRLPSNTIPYIRHVMEPLRRGISFSEYGWPGTLSEASR